MTLTDIKTAPPTAWFGIVVIALYIFVAEEGRY